MLRPSEELNKTRFPHKHQSYSHVSVSDVDPLPCYRPTDAEEVPQVADHSSVERVLLRVTVFEVQDPVAGHELPCGGVNGGQVQVNAEQDEHHHWKHPRDADRPEQESILSEPLLPGGCKDHARPETHAWG